MLLAEPGQVLWLAWRSTENETKTRRATPCGCNGDPRDEFWTIGTFPQPPRTHPASEDSGSGRIFFYNSSQNHTTVSLNTIFLNTLFTTRYVSNAPRDLRGALDHGEQD